MRVNLLVRAYLLVAYLDTAWQQFKMGGVMSAKFIRYPEKTAGTMGLFFKDTLLVRRTGFFVPK